MGSYGPTADPVGMANMAMSAPQATPCAESSCRLRIAAATLATAVPWEKRSPLSSAAGRISTSVIVLPAKSGWPLIDAGVDETDGHSGPGRRGLPFELVDVGVGMVSPDVAQPPLIREVSVRSIPLRERLRRGFEVGSRHTFAAVHGDTRGDRGRLRLRRWLCPGVGSRARPRRGSRLRSDHGCARRAGTDGHQREQEGQGLCEAPLAQL